ncbi:MAG: hypothetical protein ACXWRU_19905 [Pseudobdellovibrionaceae bacterium]
MSPVRLPSLGERIFAMGPVEIVDVTSFFTGFSLGFLSPLVGGFLEEIWIKYGQVTFLAISNSGIDELRLFGI